MKTILFLITLCLFPKILCAQDTVRFSLTDAIAFGLKNRHDIKAGEYNVKIAGNQTQKLRKEWMPDISANANVRYNTQLQETVLPAGFGGGATEQRLAFGTRNNTFLALDLTQNLYKPGLNTDILIASNTQAIEQEKNNQTQSSVKTEIAEAYLNVLLKELQWQVAQQDEKRYQNYLAVAEGKYNLQTLTESDYLTARLDYQNAKVTTEKAWQNYQTSQDDFRYEINLPPGTLFALTDNLNNQAVSDQQSLTTNVRSELKQLLLEQKGNELQLKKARENYFPTLSLYANYTTQYQADNFNYAQQAWHPFNYIGLKASLPLTGNFKTKHTVKEYQLKASQLTLNLQQKTADINHEIDQSRTALRNAIKSMQSAKASYDLSQQIYSLQNKQYDLGTLLYSKLLDTEKSLRTAEQNYVSAVYDYLVAKLTYEKAIGN